MFRSLSLMVMTLLAAPAAKAAVIVQDLQMQQGGTDQSPFDITGAQFNPALGTLTGVSATFTGIFRGDIFTPDASTSPPVVTSHLLGSLYAGGGNGFTNSEFGPITLTLFGNSYVGSAPVSLSAPFLFPDPQAFLGTQSAVKGLLEFGFFSPLGFPDGATTDSSTFDGSLVLTYSYTAIPEVPGIFVLGFGLLLLAGASRSASGRSPNNS